MASSRATRIGQTFAALLLALGVMALGGAADEIRYRPHPDSRFWIEGDAEVRRFTCRVGSVHGKAVLRDSARGLSATEGSRPTPRSPPPLDVSVTVPVRQFECGKEPMNRDLYAALKAETHPAITYRLDRVHLLPPSDTSSWRPVHATGRLTIAGSTRTVDVVAHGRRLENGRTRVRGQKALRMSKFGVDPPEALFGMIDVRDRITVHFDLIGIDSQVEPPDDLR